MKYPIVQARENGRAATSAFLGINRLPEGREGEGAEFRNLSLDLYPAASTSGLSDTGEVLYIKNDAGEKEAIDFTKLQAVAEVYDEDGLLYLTGVYDGDFYYKGQKKGYYNLINDNKKIRSTDKIVIEKIGTTYIILSTAEDRNKTIIWSYSEVGSTGTTKDKAADGLLKTDMYKHSINTDELYIYKENVDDGEEVTQSYRIFTTKTQSAAKVTQRRYDEWLEKLIQFEPYVNLKGATIHLELSQDFKYNFGKGYYNIQNTGYAGDKYTEGDFYTFDDSEEEHPVRFVLDSASSDVGINTDNGEPTPYHITEGEVPTENEHLTYLCYTLSVGVEPTSFNAKRAKHGIWGHFEKWNEKMQRYDPYNMTDAGTIWRRIQKDASGEKYVEVRPYSSSQKKFGEVIQTESITGFTAGPNTYTILKIKHIAVEGIGALISHMTAYKNRIFGVVNDGSMIVCSELGSYTDFGEFSGISTDSGYFNSLTSGKFTGISEYQGTLVVFKADRISIYYGDTPSDMVLSHEIKNVGCIDADSIKEVNGQLIFLGTDGFYSYSGGQPQRISRKLNKKYTSARAFTVGRKYYASTEDELLIYDTDTGAWTSSEKIDIKAICGERLFLADGSVKKVLDNEEWSGDWKYESMDMFEDIMDDKGINEIYIRAKLKGSMVVSTITDEEEKVHQTIKDDGEKMKVWRVPVKFKHGNYYRIRIEGSGSCILYAVERKCYAGGRVR